MRTLDPAAELDKFTEAYQAQAIAAAARAPEPEPEAEAGP
jgi:hypothetical protein